METKSTLLTFLFLLISIGFFAQSEMSIEDIDNDGDVTIELIKKIEAEHELRKMLIGVNQSSEGFLRMISDNDLSFWTKNKRRLTISNHGSIGIGVKDPQARLHINGGDIIAQTQLRIFGNIGLQEARLSFLTADTRIGGILTRGNNLILDLAQQGDIKLSINNQDHLIVQSGGNIRIPGLNGSETRNLVVDKNGNLRTEQSEAPEDIHMVIPITHFHAMFGTTIQNFFGLSIHAPNVWNHFNLDGMHMSPTFHHTKVLIKELTIYYMDEDDGKDITFVVRPPNGDEIRQESSGFSSDVQSIIFTLNFEIDQSEAEQMSLAVFGAKNDKLTIRKTKIVYQKI